MILALTDTYDDPVLIPWDKVALVDEARHDDGEMRVFEYSRVWFVGGGKSYISVKESVPQILELLNPSPRYEEVLPSAEWLEAYTQQKLADWNNE